MKSAAMKISLRFLRTAKGGATAIEYGLIAAMISAGIVGSLQLLGPALNNGFTTVATAVTNSNPNP